MGMVAAAWWSFLAAAARGIAVAGAARAIAAGVVVYISPLQLGRLASSPLSHPGPSYGGSVLCLARLASQPARKALKFPTHTCAMARPFSVAAASMLSCFSRPSRRRFVVVAAAAVCWLRSTRLCALPLRERELLQMRVRSPDESSVALSSPSLLLLLLDRRVSLCVSEHAIE